MPPISQTCTTCEHASAKSTFPRCQKYAAGKPNEYPMWEPKKSATTSLHTNA